MQDKRLFAVAVTIFIGDEKGQHTKERSVSQMVFVPAATAKEAKELALSSPEVTSCIGDPLLDTALVVVAGAVSKNMLKKFLPS